MKKISTSLQSFTSRLCIALLAVLGFSCSDDEEENILCMYGTPTGAFEVKGEVTDADGKPVANAEVRVTEPEASSIPYSYAKGVTDAAGSFSLECSGVTIGKGSKLKVVCIPADASIEADSMLVGVKRIEEGEGWYTGKWAATASFRLHSKPTE